MKNNIGKNKPLLYISWFENLEFHEIGPFFSASPDGINAYEVCKTPGIFERITIPTIYHTFSAMLWEG